MREKDAAHTLQAAEREDVPRALLAGADDGVRGDGGHRAGVVREEALPREDREAAERGQRQEQEHEYEKICLFTNNNNDDNSDKTERVSVKRYRRVVSIC